MTTTLEHLSNEIFIEIFDYIPMRNLYRSFSRLNHRINSILDSIRTRLVFQCVRPEEIHQPYVIFFAARISKLSIWHRCPLNLVHFLNIRYLELERPTIEQCNDIINGLYHHVHFARFKSMFKIVKISLVYSIYVHSLFD